MIYLMITTGLRSIELVNAKRRDLQLKKRELILFINKEGKTKNDEFVKIASGCQKALEDYLTMRLDDNPYLFISHKKVATYLHLAPTFFTYWFRSLLKDCGLEGTKFTPHCLRHTAATMNLLRGGTVEQTKALMRHVNLQSTELYVDYINRLNDDTERKLEKFILGEELHLYKANKLYIMLE